MNLYLAKLVFVVQIEGSAGALEFDEQYRIVESGSAESAFYKARNIGHSEEETFMSTNNQNVSWKFIDVSDIHSLSEYRDGEQIYSNSKKMEDSSSYIKYIRQKSMEIQVKNLTFA